MATSINHNGDNGGNYYHHQIGAFAWHRVWELPASRAEADQVYLTDEGKKHSFYAVWPFIKPLRRWVQQKRREQSGKGGGGKGKGGGGAGKAAAAAAAQQQQQQEARAVVAQSQWQRRRSSARPRPSC